METLSLFFFLLAFFFWVFPTLKAMLSAMVDSNYFYEKFVVYMKKNKKLELVWVMVAFIFINALIQQKLPLWPYLFFHGLALLILGIIRVLKKPEKIHIVWDNRIVSICICLGLFWVLLIALMAKLFSGSFLYELPFIMSILAFMADTGILLSNFVLTPVFNNKGKKDALNTETLLKTANEKRIKEGKLPIKVIGVTGTYGKSGFISIVKSVLSDYVKITASNPQVPGTIEMASKTINEGIKNDSDLILVEVMTRHNNDIENFRKSIPIDIGVITSGSEKNMESFLTKDNLLKTLAQIAVEDTKDKFPGLIANCADEYVRKIKVPKVKAFHFGTYSAQDNPQHLDLFAKNPEVRLSGTDMLIEGRKGGDLFVHVPVVGNYAANYTIAAAGIGVLLGLSNEQIAKGISKITPIYNYPEYLPVGGWPKRLEKALAKPWEEKGATTANDAMFRILDIPDEVSLDGAKDALSLMAEFKGPRIVVTRGLRGQGDAEDEANRQLGRTVARYGDYLIIIGKEKSNFLMDGAIRGTMAKDKIYMASSIKEAFKMCTEISKDLADTALVAFVGVID